jgi:IMP dehydrogenase
LHKNKIEKLLVTEKDGSLKGLITVKDILKKETYPNATRDSSGRLVVGAAVGTGDIERVNLLCKEGVDVIVVDSAHGHSQKVIDTVKQIKKQFDIDVVGGNVVTTEGTEDLISAGADAVKVGIGAGSICTTRVVTGVGIPQVTAIEVCSEVADKYNIPIVSDGGIKQYGDIAKAIAAGASSVMIGGLLAGTEEAPGKKIILRGRLYKEYRGMGSEGALETRYGPGRYFRDTKGKTVPEGVEGIVDFIGPVSEVLHDMIGGLKHAMGYAGIKTLEEFRKKAVLIEVSPGGQREAHPSVRITKEPRNYRSFST